MTTSCGWAPRLWQRRRARSSSSSQRAGRRDRGPHRPPARGRARSRCATVTQERAVDLPAGVLTTDAAAVVDDPSIDVVVEVIGGIEPARELILDGAEPRQAGRHRATRSCSPTSAPSCSPRPTPPASTSSSRPRSPVASRSCGRCASRLVGERDQPRHGHRQRHDQLHPHPDDRGGRLATARRSPKRRASATPSATRPPTSRATTPAPRRRSSRRSRSASRVVAGDVYHEGISRHHRRRHRVRQAARLRREAARHRRIDVDDGAIGVRVHPAMVPLTPSARQRARELQRGVRRGRRGRRPDVLRTRRRRRADGQCRARRPHRRRDQPPQGHRRASIGTLGRGPHPSRSTSRRPSTT